MTGTTMEADQVVLGRLLRKYLPQLEATHALVAERLADASAPAAPEPYRDLTFRHALIHFSTREAYGLGSAGDERAAAGAVLAYSIPLVWLDAILDGHRAAPIGGTGVEPATAAVLLPLLTHLGYQEIAHSGAVSIVAQEAARVVTAMRRDAIVRADPPPVVDGDYIGDYWSSDASRLHGSGIATVMMGLAAVQATGAFEPGARELSRILGVLRQLADELLDVREDLAAGLVTIPVAYALAADPVGVTPLVAAVAGGEDGPLEELVDAIFAAGAIDEIRAHADELLARARELASSCLPDSAPAVVLVEHRRSAIERAIANRLRDARRPLRVAELLAATPVS